MFTGIVECLGELAGRSAGGDNLHLHVRSPISGELAVDQSVSHNGACLTVVRVEGDMHIVTAIRETLDRTALGALAEGEKVNLERAMKLGDRLDGHLVQGHVDTTAEVVSVAGEGGSWRFRFSYAPVDGQVLVEKGSICVDGVSPTLTEAGPDRFAVAVIPYTFEHTRFGGYRPGDRVNVEFDLIGKYVERLVRGYDVTGARH